MNISQLMERVKAILLTPKAAWESIKGDNTTISGIYGEYLAPLAVIPAVASFIGQSVVGVTLPIVGHYRKPIASGLVSAVLCYVFTLIGIYIAAKVIEALAPTFGATKNGLNAFKVAAYSSTPALVAGVLSIIPTLSPLAILAGLYGIYLLYLGLGALMVCPAEKSIGYTAASVVAMILISVLVGVLAGGLTLGLGSRSGGTRVGESVAEKIIEAQLGSQGDKAKVNIRDGKFTVQTKEGKATYSGGEGAQIPEAFPKDVYVPEGAKVLSSVTVPQGFNVALTTKTAVDKVLAEFKEKMTASGWSESMSLNQGEQSMLAYQKDKRTANVVVTKADNQTQVVLTVIEEKESQDTESNE